LRLNELAEDRCPVRFLQENNTHAQGEKVVDIDGEKLRIYIGFIIGMALLLGTVYRYLKDPNYK